MLPPYSITLCIYIRCVHGYNRTARESIQRKVFIHISLASTVTAVRGLHEKAIPGINSNCFKRLATECAVRFNIIFPTPCMSKYPASILPTGGGGVPSAPDEERTKSEHRGRKRPPTLLDAQPAIGLQTTSSGQRALLGPQLPSDGNCSSRSERYEGARSMSSLEGGKKHPGEPCHRQRWPDEHSVT